MSTSMWSLEKSAGFSRYSIILYVQYRRSVAFVWLRSAAKNQWLVREGKGAGGLGVTVNFVSANAEDGLGELD